VVAAGVVQAPNNKQQLSPMLDQVSALPERLGKADVLLADNGYFSEANVEARAAAAADRSADRDGSGTPPSIPGRALCRRAAPPDAPTPLKTMAHRLKTPYTKSLRG